MKRSEAFWILNEMYELANEAQKQALNIAQRDIEFVDLMPDVPVQRWIPVTERLPKDFEHVLVYYEYFRYGEYNRLYRAIGTSYTFQGSWSGFVNGTSGWRDLKILAWMPLPEPPKEDAE